MKDTKSMPLAYVTHGEALAVLRTIPAMSAHSVVTDPPAGIKFLGAKWDGDRGGRDKWIAWLAEVFVELRRIAKPGAYAAVWALPKHAHWTATAIEDAGWEIIDVSVHLFGNGMPKPGGTTLKPSAEHWILARVPPSCKPIADNVSRHGTGRLNLDACKIGPGRSPSNASLEHTADCVHLGEKRIRGAHSHGNLTGKIHGTGDGATYASRKPTGRQHVDADGYEQVEAWACVSECPVRALDEKSGRNASRFFYVPKPARSERAGHPTEKSVDLMRQLCRLVTPPGGLVLDPFAGSGTTLVAALAEGLRAIGIEQDAAFVKLATRRIYRETPE